MRRREQPAQGDGAPREMPLARFRDKVPAMRRVTLLFAMILLAPAASAWAQTEPADPAAAAAEPAAPTAAAEQAPAAAAPDAPGAMQMRQRADGRPSVMPEPVRLRQKPSGFWTSGRPAVGGAYRYRLLGIGVGIVALMIVLVVWVVRRQPRRTL